MLRKPGAVTEHLEARLKALTEKAGSHLWGHLLPSDDPRPRPENRSEVFRAATELQLEHSQGRISDAKAAADVGLLSPLVDDAIAAYRAHWAAHPPPSYQDSAVM